MYIAMNRFRITLGREQEFIEIWQNRESYLDEVPGFVEFHLLQGASDEEATLFATHVVWKAKEDFEAWTQSESFAKAHAQARTKAPRELYLGPPHFEGFDAVL